MLFTSPLFLFTFLPLTLLAYYGPLRWSRRLQNLLLLGVSLVFYGYGEPAFIKILIVSVFANWAAGWVVGEHARFRKLAMWASVAANVGLLFYFKYLAFGVGQINACFGTAWRVPDIVLPLGISFFTFQIFFDFSGYSDMAIGLGRMFGFHFLENFDHPYVSRSVSEFWRRWHISMGTWFRDYVYFPLGGSRSATRTRNLLNLFVVWTLTGIWHGANWTFLVWGLMYFVLIACEKLLWTGRREVPGASTSVLGWAYTMFFVMVGWVFFRATSLAQGWRYLGTLFGYGVEFGLESKTRLLISENAVFLVFAVLFSMPLRRWSQGIVARLRSAAPLRIAGDVLYAGWIVGIMMLSVSYLAKGTHNPFIYFNF